MFANQSLKAKLMMLCLFFSCVTGVVGGVSYYFAASTNKIFRSVIESDLASVISLGTMRSAFKDVRIFTGSLAIEGTTQVESNKIIENARKAIATYAEREKKYNVLPFNDSEEKVYKEQLVPAWNHYVEVSNKVLKLAENQGKEAQDQMRVIFSKEGPEASAATTKALADLEDLNDVASQKSTAAAIDQGVRGNIIVLSLTVISFILAIFIGILFSNRLTSTFSKFAGNLSESATELHSASSQIAESGTELSASATEQAAALQETVASVDEISAMINKNADNSKTSQDFAQKSQDTATKGKKVVENMIRSIDEIDRSNADIMNQVESSNKEISDIVKVIAEIGTKTKVINDIVFQTKLLSFNASVEAARAGEHGKGFAVVAEEVGNLAQMSGNAAKEISQLLDGSIQKVEKIVSDTKSKAERLIALGKEKVAAGTLTARQCGEVLDEIVANVSAVGQMTNEIATASHEQSQGVQEITKAMAQLDQVTQQNASASQQSSDAAEKLTSQSKQLNDMVNELVSLIKGGGSLESSHQQSASTSRVIKQNVILMQPRKNANLNTFSQNHSTQSVKIKKAVGESIPSENDPRFKDV